MLSLHPYIAGCRLQADYDLEDMASILPCVADNFLFYSSTNIAGVKCKVLSLSDLATCLDELPAAVKSQLIHLASSSL